MFNKMFATMLTIAASAAPVAAQGGPSTRPAHGSTEGAVLILPFRSKVLPDGGSLGSSVQQELASDLAGDLKANIAAPATTQPAADAKAALQAGRDARAGYVVFGQVETAGGLVRISGQVLAVGSGSSRGSIKATGPAEGLFRLEDVAASQLLASLPRSALTLRGLVQRDAMLRPANQPSGQIDGTTVRSAQANVPMASQYAGDVRLYQPGPYTAGQYPSGPYGQPDFTWYSPYRRYSNPYPTRFEYPYLGELRDRDPFLFFFGGPGSAHHGDHRR